MRKLIIPVLILIVLGVVGLRLYEELVTSSDGRPPGSVGPGGPGGPGGGRVGMLVQLEEARMHVFTSSLDVLGELAPLASVDVMSRISGRLKEVRAERGDFVSRGQLLAVVDDEDLLQQIRRAEASIAVARASVQREQASTENLQLQANRYQRLFVEKLISEQDLQDLESRLRVSQAQVQLAQAQVDQAEASLRELRVQQQQTQIYSPMDGFVGVRYLDPGALVNASVPILSVVDVSRLKTVVPVPEADLRRVSPGLGGEVRVDAYPDQVYRGTVTRISPLLNPATRTGDIEIEIPNPSRLLKPGMFARVSLKAETARPALAIPRSALLTRGELKGVYLLNDDLTTRFQRIEIGRIQGDMVEVLSGIEAGAKMVGSGAQKLNEGDKVIIG